MDDIRLAGASLDEQETQISISYLTKKAYVYTSRSSVAQSLKDVCDAYPEKTSVRRNDPFGYEVELPMDWILIRPKKKRVVSEERKRVLSAQLEAARKKRGETA